MLVAWILHACTMDTTCLWHGYCMLVACSALLHRMKCYKQTTRAAEEVLEGDVEFPCNGPGKFSTLFAAWGSLSPPGLGGLGAARASTPSGKKE